jgi:predicted DNA binding CopG/RHH family protein
MTRIERRKEAIKPIPPFETIEEEAEFWDSHSAVDEIDEGTLVGFRRSRKTGSLTIRFQPEEIQRIREQASQRGIGPTTLARMWILERLSEQKQRSA